MMYFWEKEKSNLKDIGKTLLLDPSTLTPLIKKLETKGYITREKSTIDERNLEITITDKGKKLKDKAKDIPKKMGKCIDLSNKEAKQFKEIFDINSVNKFEYSSFIFISSSKFEYFFTLK